MVLVAYPLKKALLKPRTRYRRMRDKDLDPQLRKAFENHYYSKGLYGFIGHTVENPVLVVDFPLDESSTVFDVGAYDGDWAGALWDRYHPTIYAFEPSRRPRRALTAGVGANDRVHVFDYGLGRSDHVGRLGLAAAGSGFHKAGVMGAVDVPVRDIAGVLEELGLERLTLLKVNIEGGEYDLLDRLAETGWLDRIDHLLIQFHEWQPRAYWRRFRNRRDLARTHDEIWCHSWMWEYWRHRGVEQSAEISR